MLLSLKFNDRNYDAWLLKGLIDFNVDKNIDESFISIKKLKNMLMEKMNGDIVERFYYFLQEIFKKLTKYVEKSRRVVILERMKP